MKKLTLLLTLLSTLFVLDTQAQSLEIGPELGINLVALNNTGARNYQLGINGGIRTQFNFNEKIGLLTGIYYTDKRQAYASVRVTSFTEEYAALFETIGGIPEDFEGFNLDIIRTYKGAVNARSVEIPLQVAFKSGKIQFSIGGYAGYIISAENRGTIREQTPLFQIIDIDQLLGNTGSGTPGIGSFIQGFLPAADETKASETKSLNGLNRLDYGLKGGISFISSENLSFNLSYQHGLKDYREDPLEGDDFKPYKNIVFTLAYQWGIEKKTDKTYNFED